MRNTCRMTLVLITLGRIASTGVMSAEPGLTDRLGEPFVERLIAIDGGQLCCVERAGAGPTLMLIPGTFSDSRAFSRLVPHLDRELHLLLVENRGLGRSWPPPEHGSIEQCAHDALLIAKDRRVKQFYVGGHSLGGMISIELARTAPEKLRGVISIEGWSHWTAARDAFQSDMKSTLSESQLDELARYRLNVLRNWTEEQQSAFGQIWRNWDGDPILRTTTLPVLELYGDRGRKPATREQLRIPDRENICLEWFQGASHSLHYERPQQVAESINEFIRRGESTSVP